MNKSPEAFRTISEVAETLDVPPHVLRFWESRFPQVKPVKRGGGRRYYRPEDVRLLRGIRGLLYDDGMTIKGVQKILRERGVRHVAGLASPADGEATETAAPSPRRPRAPRVAAPDGDGRLPGGTTAEGGIVLKAEVADRDALRALVAELEALRAVMAADPTD